MTIIKTAWIEVSKIRVEGSVQFDKCLVKETESKQKWEECCDEDDVW